jgi:hypothetical protein
MLQGFGIRVSTTGRKVWFVVTRVGDRQKRVTIGLCADRRLQNAASVGRHGSIAWLCWPRFDSAACFAALLGGADNGHWLIAPKDSLLGDSPSSVPGR